MACVDAERGQLESAFVDALHDDPSAKSHGTLDAGDALRGKLAQQTRDGGLRLVDRAHRQHQHEFLAAKATQYV